MIRTLRRSLCLGIAWGLFISISSSAFALEPDELVLVCNRRVPASVQLATFYAQARNVPADRIVELDLPDGEQISADKVDRDLIIPLRQAILDRNLKSKTKCLLTFYGVPLRVGPWVATPQETAELMALKQQNEELSAKAARAVSKLEDRIKTLDPAFAPASAGNFEQTLRRYDAALKHGAKLLQGSSDPQARHTLTTMLAEAVQELAGPVGLLRHFNVIPATSPASTQPTDPAERREALLRQVRATTRETEAAIAHRWDPASRQRARDLAKANFGLIDTARIVQFQLEYLGQNSVMSLDNQLAWLWADTHQYKSFSPNPLHYKSSIRSTTPAIMVMRLDGPQSGTARDIIMACKSVEANGGLQGKVVLDSRGLRPQKPDGTPDGLGMYDQRVRDLADLIRKHTQLSLITDDSDRLLPAHSQNDVALYFGWYSVRNYVPCCQFVPGAIGFHLASYEMVSLRNPSERGWCRGVLLDGIAATLGPVDEPYSLAFPDPVDYFGLILTGKYTLAEVTWATGPCINWRITAIGDPLYNPYARRPALQPEDLPEPLRTFATKPQSPATTTTQPITTNQ